MYFLLENLLQVSKELFFKFTSTIALFARFTFFVHFLSITFEALWSISTIFNFFFRQWTRFLILSVSSQLLQFLIRCNINLFDFCYKFLSWSRNFSWSRHMGFICRWLSLWHAFTFEWRELALESFCVHSLQIVILEWWVKGVLIEWWVKSFLEWFTKVITKFISLSLWSKFIRHLERGLSNWRHSTHSLQVVLLLWLWKSAPCFN